MGGVFEITPGVVYVADQDQDEVFELFSVPAGGGAARQLNGTLVEGGDVAAFRICPDSAHVLYVADQVIDEAFVLYSVSITGGSAVPVLAPASANPSFQTSFLISPGSRRVVSNADVDLDGGYESLLGVSITGGASLVLNGPLVQNGRVLGYAAVTGRRRGVATMAPRKAHMDTEQDESARLLERAQGGDARAVDELLARHLSGLRAFVRLRASPALLAHESASDLVQSVCVEILRHPERFAYGGEAGFRHWLYTTALRKLSNRGEFWTAEKREAARGVALPDDPEAADAALLARYSSFCTPSRAAMAREELERVEAAFRELPEDERAVIVLAKVVGLSRAEIGSEMGRSELAVRSLLSRALSRLAEALE